MKTIVIPFDFSTNARKALEYAIHLGKDTESPIYVYHVLHESPYKLAASSGEQEMEMLIQKDEKEKTAALKQEVNNILHSLSLNFGSDRITVKAEYNPLITERILELSKKQNAGLIVMGTHGASGIRKFLFGSNTSNMIAKSDIPVLAIPEKNSYTPVKTILYASDLEDLRAELDRIIPFAKSLHAFIDVLHINYGPNEKKITTDAAKEITGQSVYQYINLLIRDADTLMPLLKQIRNYMQEQMPEWLVMFTRERSMWNKLFIGSKTEDMSLSLQLPLLSFKKPG